MDAYLTQSICLDNQGNPTATLPIDPSCTRTLPQTAADTATYRKHDWPDAADPRHPLTGYQASDSVLTGHRIVQTFDFGDTQRAFGRFDGGQGDGGQVALIVDGWASFAMTEDGGDGVQWFISDTCRTDPTLNHHFQGWLLFAADATSDWHDRVTHLNKGRAPTDCPIRFNPAYTRYRTARVTFPFRIVTARASLQTRSIPLDTIVSEHYGGTGIASADHLERFYFAKNLGLIRWERWAHPSFWSASKATEAADNLTHSGRCPSLNQSEPLDLSWKRVDCRTWTTLVTPQHPWSVADYHWPALEQTKVLDSR